MRIMCGELDKTARAGFDVNSTDFGHASPVLSSPPPRFLSAGAACLSRFCLLTSSMMSCLHRIRCRLRLFLRDTCPPSSANHTASLLCLPASPYRLACLIAPPLSAFRPVPRVVKRGDAMLRALIACFSCPCDVVSGRWRWRAPACLVMSGDAAMSIAEAWFSYLVHGSPVRRRCDACRLSACLLGSSRIHRPSSSRFALLPASPPSRSFAPYLVSGDGER